MKKRTVGILTAIVVALLFGISGLILAFAGGIPALAGSMAFMQGASLNAIGSSTLALFSVLSQGGSCCICIPIPLAFGFLALRQHVKASVVEEPLSSSL